MTALDLSAYAMAAIIAVGYPGHTRSLAVSNCYQLIHAVLAEPLVCSEQHMQ